ncbi:hypothetical protein Ae706Ps2_1604 [Pseudonocardia sp. Ae706_Ps2]|nr:hypothetical protein Ae706Ps2_1604 [Pseudonocardia sp. Ae706_Ps2]
MGVVGERGQALEQPGVGTGAAGVVLAARPHVAGP